MKKKFVSSSLIAVLLAVTALAAQENPDKILKKVRENYEKIETLSADFQKQYVWTLAEETQTMNGKIFLKRGDRYRVETDLQTIVTNGKTVWTYSPQKQQVFIDKLESSEENPLPGELLAKYTRDYKARYLREESLEGRNCHVILLTPRDDNSFVQTVTVWIDQDEWITIQVEELDLNENITRYKLSNLQFNNDMVDSMFSFQVPETAEIIDLR